MLPLLCPSYILVIHNVESFPKCSQASRHGEIVAAASFAVLRRFNDVEVPEPIAVESCNRGGEGFEWVVIRHIVETTGRRDSYADMIAIPGFQDAFHCFREKADSIRRNTSIFIGSPIRSCSEKLIDHASIATNLDPIKSGFFRVGGCPSIVVQSLF